ncbi:ornithine carbamoyltransferase [Candidatus Micrarchaeota archaeon]|nr:ornithine carbamoyltransferase [Candidatus Micrarchaeota archaeon]
MASSKKTQPVPASVQPRHFRSVTDLSQIELREVLTMADALKKDPLSHRHDLDGKSLAFYTEKTSTRTRLSFQAAIQQLGGNFMDMAGSQFGAGKEDVSDTAQMVGLYSDFLAARVFKHSLLSELAASSCIPVINALSDVEHPCQALADVQTILAHKGPRAIVAYVGDGNNVAASLALACSMLGLRFQIATPKGYELKADILARCRTFGDLVHVGHDPNAAVKGADVIYTDVWVSMGDEKEKDARVNAFDGFQVDATLMKRANHGAIFMHCLPAQKGMEVSKEVFDSSASVVIDQAENRLHAQKALLLFLHGEKNCNAIQK